MIEYDLTTSYLDGFEPSAGRLWIHEVSRLEYRICRDKVLPTLYHTSQQTYTFILSNQVIYKGAPNYNIPEQT